MNAATNPETGTPLAEAEQEKQKSFLSFLVTYSGFIIFAQIALLAFLVQRDTLTMNALHSRTDIWAREQKARQDKQNDPKVGSSFGIAQTAKLRNAIAIASKNQGQSKPQAESSPSPSVLFIFTGPCSSCVSKDLRKWQELSHKYVGHPIVIVSRDSKQGIDGYIKTTGFTLPIIEDQSGAISHAFNAEWVPRAYQISPDGVLQWIQAEDATPPELIVQQIWNVKQAERKMQ